MRTNRQWPTMANSNCKFEVRSNPGQKFGAIAAPGDSHCSQSNLDGRFFFLAGSKSGGHLPLSWSPNHTDS
ncbi:hypothetical protein KFU94_62860 [Chloroflexi bacterium TSY]|nr:hypothetical protein [Chloroflexi bacterium TSY]